MASLEDPSTYAEWATGTCGLLGDPDPEAGRNPAETIGIAGVYAQLALAAAVDKLANAVQAARAGSY